MKKDSYQLAIVGLGGMGDWHRDIIGSIEGLKICGSYDIREERQQYAAEHGLHVYHSLEEVIADENCDIVLIATPNQHHKEIALKALNHKKHVVCEKPAVLCSADMAEIMTVAGENNSLFVVHQNRRWDEDYLTVKRIIEEKQLGEIHRIESRVHGSRGIPGDWRQLKECGGGMVLDWGVHILDQVLQMVPGKIESVYATLTYVTNELVDDGFTALLRFAQGPEVLLEVGTSNFIDLPRWYLLGQNGSAVIRDWDLSGEIVLVKDWSLKDAVPVRTAAGLTKTMAPRTADSIVTEPLPVVESDIRDFYKNVRDTLDGSGEILVKNQEVMRVIRLMEAIFASAEQNQVVGFDGGVSATKKAR